MLVPLRPEPVDDGMRELVARAAAGDRASARRVLERVAPAVHRVVRTVLGPSAPFAEDVAQDALVALVRAFGSFRGECGVVHFACRIATRVAMAARRARAAEAHLTTLDALGEDDALELPAHDRQVAADDDAEAPRRRALVRTLLDELPEAQAETLALRVMLGYSIAEVAAATGVPMNTVRSRLRLAKEALKSRITEDPRLAELLEVG